jgi:hypothetical protein
MGTPPKIGATRIYDALGNGDLLVRDLPVRKELFVLG